MNIVCTGTEHDFISSLPAAFTWVGASPEPWLPEAVSMSTALWEQGFI